MVVNIYIVERCLYAARVKHLKKLANKSSFLNLQEEPNENTTHIIASSSTRTEVVQYLTSSKKYSTELLNVIQNKAQFLDIEWFTECMKNKGLVDIEKRHLLFDKQDLEPPKKKLKVENDELILPTYACQRKTPLKHHNHKFTDALEILESHAFFRGDINGEVRALAFRRGSAVLKSLPKPVINENDINNLPHIDQSSTGKPGHCKRIILEIIRNGFSDEVEAVRESEYFKTMKIFAGIFGIGPQTAQKWFREKNMRTLDDVKNNEEIKLNKDQTFGLRYYEDLNRPVTRKQADQIKKEVFEVANAIVQGIEVILVGGFRRGKPNGHDVDLLITHSTEGKERNVLERILEKMNDNFIYTDKKYGFNQSTFTHGKSSNVTSRIDQFEKCFGIYSLKNTTSDKEITLAVRVDLIIVPYSQMPFALLGWTGSKHFEREIRRYAKLEKQITLTSHGMFLNNQTSISANSEEEIFKELGLEFIEPEMRNC